MTETWKSIPEFPGYDVSDHGRVRSYYAVRNIGGTLEWYIAEKPQTILKTRAGHNSYLGLTLTHSSGKRYRRLVHSLVMLAFVGPRPANKMVCHRDDNPANNHLENLRYDTHAGNHKDLFRNNPRAWSRFARDEVITIRNRRATGESTVAIAADYGIHPSCISKLCRGVTYSNDPGPLVMGRYTTINIK